MLWCIFDLDGCFADFHGAIVKHCKVNHYKDNPKKVWETLETIPYLFRTLEVLPGSLELFDLIYGKHGPENVQILTALPQLTNKLITAPLDKVMWVRRNLSASIAVNCAPTWRDKKKWVTGPHDILLDDMERNIEDWTEAGGIGVHHRTVEESIDKLKALGVL